MDLFDAGVFVHTLWHWTLGVSWQMHLLMKELFSHYMLLISSVHLLRHWFFQLLV
nr:hypothetical protein Iba_chr11cCG13330 [Ipomoea batatas]